MLALFALVAQEGGGVLAHLAGEILAHVLDLVGDEGGRVLERGLGDGGLEHGGAELLLGPLFGALAQLIGDPRAQLGECLELVGDFHCEVVVGIGQFLLLDFVNRGVEGHGLPCDFVVGPVFVHIDVELVLNADLEAEQLLEQSGQGDLLALAQEELRAALAEHFFFADEGAEVGGDLIVELGRALDRFEQGVAAAQREHLLVDQIFAVFALGACDGDAAVVAQLDGGRQGDGDAQGERLAGGDLDFGRRDRFQPFAVERFLHGLGQHPLGGFLEDGVGAERALDDLAGRFAFAEAGDAVALREAARGLIERALNPLVVQLDVEHHLSFGDAFRSDLHSPTTRSRTPARVAASISAPLLGASGVICRAG